VADLVSLGVEVQTKGAAQSAQQLGQFQAAAKGAAGAADVLEDQLRATSTAQTQVANTARPLTGAMQGVGQAFSRHSFALQNASFQLQDIVVQMSMGVPAARTLGMQLPQLLGGFGPLGAVVGLAVGALLSFGPAMLNTADAAGDLEDAIDKLDAAMRRHRETQKGLSATALAHQYGAQAEAARVLLGIQRQIAQIEADRAFRGASTAVVGALGGELASLPFGTAVDNALALNNALRERVKVEEMILQIQRGELVLSDEEHEALSRRQLRYQETIEQLDEYRRGLQNLSAQFGLSEQSAANLVIAMTAVTMADTTEQRVDATQNLARAIDGATKGLSMASDEGIALYNALLDAAMAGLDLQSLNLPDNLKSAAGEATRLADEMGRAAANAITMATQSFTARNEADLRLRHAGDPIAEARALAEARFSAANPLMVNAPVGGQTFATAKQTYVENAVAAAAAQLALQQLNETMGDGATKGGAYGRAIEDLNEQLDPFAKLIAGVADSVENELNRAFSAVLDGTKSLGNALLDFASNVLVKVAQDLFAQQFAGPLAAGISALFSANGNVFDQSGVTAFAKGGVVGGPTIFPFANGIGLMGEAGPEAIMPLSRGADGKLGVVAANSSGAPSITINNYSGQEATASSDSAGNILIEIGRAVAQDITAGGPAYRAIRTTFGLSSRLQQRG
jgi:hypothetical protein